MGKLILFIIILITGAIALARPWVGICSYYLLAILSPQDIWWWNFEGLRISLIVAVCTILGLIFKISNKNNNYKYSFLLNKQNFWLGLLWFFLVVSYFYGPYVNLFRFSGLYPAQVFSLINTFFFFYFCAALEMNEVQKLRYLVIIFSFSTIYLAYWANTQYFSQNWAQFNMGRLMGPTNIYGKGIYRDENAFAMFFVTGLPFIYYLGWELRQQWQRIALWLVIPFGWHAIFLTGSRGGLLGIGVVMLSIAFLSKRKFLALPLLLLFVLFYQWQAGAVMETRSATITNIEGERSAGDRLTAWKGGIRMAMAHPITGVGLGSYMTALPDYIQSRSMVAHNTLIQFAAESGVGAALAYSVLVVMFIVNSIKIRRWCVEHIDLPDARKIDLYNNASTVSFVGLFVCSVFLSLNSFEIFFVLLLFNNALLQICIQNSIVFDNRDCDTLT